MDEDMILMSQLLLLLFPREWNCPEFPRSTPGSSAALLLGSHWSDLWPQGAEDWEDLVSFPFPYAFSTRADVGSQFG